MGACDAVSETMTFHQAESIRYFTFDHFDPQAITHAVFTRQGGVSPQPWDSLNMGGLVGDDLARVAQNRVAAFRAVGRAPESLFDVWQVHSAEVVFADAPRPFDQPHPKADIILTDRPEVSIFMRFADCVPILLHDPQRAVVGLVHAGWQGTVKRAAVAAVHAMQSRYACKAENIRAGIGPSIGAHHYEVGPEVVAQVRQVFGGDASDLLPRQDGAVQFDLWAANRLLLEQAGLQHIQAAEICTACKPGDWYSHRGEQGKTGRFGALIALNL